MWRISAGILVGVHLYTACEQTVSVGTRGLGREEHAASVYGSERGATPSPNVLSRDASCTCCNVVGKYLHNNDRSSPSCVAKIGKKI